MKEVCLDLTPFSEKKALHAYLKSALDLPNYYNATLDALHDELTGITTPVSICVVYPANPIESMAGYLPQLLDVFRNAALQNYNLTLAFTPCDEKEAKKNGLDIQDIYQFIKKAGTYYIATAEKDQPRVRPFGTIDLFEGRLYIQTGKKKMVSAQIHQNPKVELCALLEGKWLRLAGELVQDDRYEAKNHMLDAYPDLRTMYAPDDDNTEVLYFRNAHAVIYTFGEQPHELQF